MNFLVSISFSSALSASLLYPVVNKEVKQEFPGRGVTLQQEKPAVPTSLNINSIGKAALLNFPRLLAISSPHPITSHSKYVSNEI
jgi:hypothetical protein